MIAIGTGAVGVVDVVPPHWRPPIWRAFPRHWAAVDDGWVVSAVAVVMCGCRAGGKATEGHRRKHKDDMFHDLPAPVEAQCQVYTEFMTSRPETKS